jgi:hypothetical protein
MSYWTYEDMTQGRCGARDIGRPRDGDAQGDCAVLVEDLTPAGIVETAVRTLMRACSQSRDQGLAVKAATALLRYYAPPRPYEQPLLQPQEPPALTMDEEQWLNRFSQARPEPEPPQDTAQATPEPPAASEPPSRAISPPSGDSKLVPDTGLPRLRVVQAEPRFWASPTVPRADN